MFETVMDMPEIVRLGLPRDAQEIVRGMIHVLVYDDNIDSGAALAKVQKGLKNAGYKWSGSRWEAMTKKYPADKIVTKTVNDQHLAFGWANVIEKDGKILVDRQGDFIDDVAEIEKAAYQFVLQSRVAGDMHVNVGVGDLVESMMFTKEKLEKMNVPEGLIPQGWWVGFKVSDDEVWEKLKTGRYTSLSVAGTGLRSKTLYSEDTHTTA